MGAETAKSRLCTWRGSAKYSSMRTILSLAQEGVPVSKGFEVGSVNPDLSESVFTLVHRSPLMFEHVQQSAKNALETLLSSPSERYPLEVQS